ncbi:hypothetical protein [Methanosarcina horonobensis]|uniref:hypothetical protein n=1 Tax=Methanosarcina horonobensis TaxID=418008 RepID=UPI00064F2470|nr:hypothetical protein [Methanosarcina horonobensis]
MSDQDTIKDHATTVVGFAGLLLGLLVNALTTIKFEEFNNTLFNNISYTTTYLKQLTVAISLKFLFLTAASCLLISIINAFSTHSELISPKKTKENQIINDPAKILEVSVKWLSYGLGVIAFIIAIMITKSAIYTVVYVVIFIIALLYDYRKMHKGHTNQQSIEIEERSI